MFSYDAKAVQGFDATSDGIHFVPGTIHPSLDDGDQFDAYVATRDSDTNEVEVTELTYARGVDAVSAVFMHDTLSNTFTIQEDLAAATEWVLTFPTKNWYVDPNLLGQEVFYIPDEDDSGLHP